MIDLVSVTRTYPHESGHIHALKNVSMIVPDGSIFGIVGQSGAGKSTLIRCVNGLERPTSGHVLINGLDLTILTASELREARRGIGMIFQHFNLADSRTVQDNIALPLRFAGTGTPEIKARVDELIKQCELIGLEQRYPSQLSGGQKQRVAIARALAHKPKVLLCDEATSALDPKTSAQILNLLKRLNRETGLTILLITHEMSVVKAICDKVGIMDQGQLVEAGPVLDVFSEPKSVVAKQFVADTMQMSIPALIKERLIQSPSSTTDSLYGLTYVGEITSSPILSTCIVRFGVTVNILQANIEMVQDQILGRMMVTISGSAEAERQTIAYLKEHGLQIESLGYVRQII